MADPGDEAVLREILPQGERMLAMQDSAHEAAMRRAGDLLRLTVAALAGVIVLTGILAAARSPVGPFAAAVGALGVFLLLGSAVILALVLAGHAQRGAFACGPDLGAVLQHTYQAPVSAESLVRSIAEGLPGWLSENEALLAGIRRRNSRAVLVMVTGVGAILMALVYITGDAILG